MKKFALPLIAIFGFASPLLAQQPAAGQPAVTQADAKQGAQEDRVVEEIVARVNNSIITRADLRRNLAQSEQAAKQENLSASEMRERETNALRDLIDQQLLVQKAAELGITADAETVKRLDDLRKQMKVGSMEELQKIAESQGVSWEEFKQNTKNGILTQKVIGSEVGSHIQITQTEVQKYYDEHKSEFTQPERVRLSEILIANDPSAPKGAMLEPPSTLVAAAQDKANEIYQQLKGGANFEELARKVSNGPTAEQGGDLGYFKRNDLAKELETQTFALKAGEFTKPIRTRQGFIVLLVSDHIEAGTPPFDRVREQIQDQLYTQRIQPALRTYLTKLRDEAYIDVKPGFTDSGASPNQSHLVWATDSGPRTKQVRGKMGLGKKKTVLVGEDAKRDREATTTSELGLDQNQSTAKEDAAEKRKEAKEAAAAKAAEKEKLSHMSPAERKKYLAEKKAEAKKEAKLKREEQRKENDLADAEAQRKADEADAARHSKKHKKHEAKASQPATPAQTTTTTAQAPAKAAEEPSQTRAQKRETKAQEKARWKQEDRQDKLARKQGTQGKESQADAGAKQSEPAVQADKPAENAAAADAPSKAAEQPAPAQQPKEVAKAPEATHAATPHESKAQEKQRLKEEDRQDKLARKEAKRKAKEAKADKHGKKSNEASQASSTAQAGSTQADAGEQSDPKQTADTKQPEKKKKFSWF